MENQEQNKALVVFQDRKIRRVWFNDEWWFSVVDIVAVLSESQDPRNYWKVLKHRINEEGSEVVTNCNQLKLIASDGKFYDTDCVNTKNAFRIIQSIPSPKAEPFKLWLAKVGYERIQEIENPEIAQDRVKEYYRLKGYPKEWIEKRMRGIAIRQDLTEEWKGRGVEDEQDFAILTNEITKATFGKTVQEYKQFKSLDKKNQNLRDHMSDWELILTMIGEKATTDLTVAKDSKGFVECKECAVEGGSIASNTRKELEHKLGKAISTSDNFLKLGERKKKGKLIEGKT